MTLPSLVAQQRYDISLHLTVPATESNYALGNFMTSLTLSTSSNKTLTSIRRPVGHLTCPTAITYSASCPRGNYSTPTKTLLL